MSTTCKLLSLRIGKGRESLLTYLVIVVSIHYLFIQNYHSFSTAHSKKTFVSTPLKHTQEKLSFYYDCILLLTGQLRLSLQHFHFLITLLSHSTKCSLTLRNLAISGIICVSDTNSVNDLWPSPVLVRKAEKDWWFKSWCSKSFSNAAYMNILCPLPSLLSVLDLWRSIAYQ